MKILGFTVNGVTAVECARNTPPEEKDAAVSVIPPVAPTEVILNSE